MYNKKDYDRYIDAVFEDGQYYTDFYSRDNTDKEHRLIKRQWYPGVKTIEECEEIAYDINVLYFGHENYLHKKKYENMDEWVGALINDTAFE